MIRNRISAQKSRFKKKEEVGQLQDQVEILKNKYKELIQILDENICDTCK